MKVAGFDPGKKGAGAVLDTETRDVAFFKMPLMDEIRNKKTRQRFDRKVFAQMLREEIKADFYFIEDIWSFGVQHKKQSDEENKVQTGSTSMFNFAGDYTALLTVFDILGVPYTLVSPTKWQNKVGKKGDKQESINLAQKLFPKADLIPPRCRVPSDGRAEALLIAYCGAKILGAMQ